MTVTDLRAFPAGETAEDQPRRIRVSLPRSDRAFHQTITAVSVLVLVIFGSIGIFLGWQLIPTFRHYGTQFLTGAVYLPSSNKIGIAGAIVGTFEIALVALVVAVPLSFLTALYISEYSPLRVRSFLVSVIDLMAAIPSVIIGAWGYFALMPHAKYIARWLDQYFGWIPIFRVPHADANSATWPQSQFVGSAFVAGLCVSMMVIPIACAVMRGVFAQAPLGEREAAYALGSTRWGMVRTVVVPFGRGGIIGGIMLGLGRALGETIAVVLILNFSFGINFRVLQSGSVTISSLIANGFGEATGTLLSALLAAGFVLFVITLVVNTIAAAFVVRSRSGAATEI